MSTKNRFVPAALVLAALCAPAGHALAQDGDPRRPLARHYHLLQRLLLVQAAAAALPRVSKGR